MFYLIISAFQLDLAFTTKNDLTYTVKTDKTFTMDIPYDCIQVDQGKSCGVNCCKVQISKDTEFTVKQPHLDLLSNTIAQNDRQEIVYKFEFPTLSIPIPTIDLSITTKNSINASSNNKHKSRKATFELKPNEDCFIHFSNPTYGPIITEYHRKVYIEHYSGILNIHNNYVLVNKGSKLDYFNRADYVKQRGTFTRIPIIQQLEFNLPHVDLPWVRDLVGNISTSNFRQLKSTKSLLEIKPRYPIFGGWQFEFGNGYLLPSQQVMKVGTLEELMPLLKKPVLLDKHAQEHSNTNAIYYMTTIRLADLPQYPCISCTTEIVLPEGAHSIYIQTKVNKMELNQNKEYSYFDVMGRKTIVLNSFYRSSSGSLKILYALSPFDAYLRKVTTITLGVFSVFMSLLMMSKINLKLQ